MIVLCTNTIPAYGQIQSGRYYSSPRVIEQALVLLLPTLLLVLGMPSRKREAANGSSKPSPGRSSTRAYYCSIGHKASDLCARPSTNQSWASGLLPHLAGSQAVTMQD